MFISFGLNGTIVDSTHLKRIWNEEIPAFFAKQNSLDVNEAKKIVFSEYYSARSVEGVMQNNWENIEYWIERLKIPEFRKEFDSNAKKFFTLYPEVKNCLELLKKEHSLVLITGVNSDLLELELRTVGLLNYFEQVFSSYDISEGPKTPKTFSKALEALNCSTEELIHIGSNYERDYLFPSSVGIVSYLLDRRLKYKEANEFKVLNLNEFVDKTGLV